MTLWGGGGCLRFNVVNISCVKYILPFPSLPLPALGPAPPLHPAAAAEEHGEHAGADMEVGCASAGQGRGTTAARTQL